MDNLWANELWRIVGLCAIALLVGLLAGHPLAVLLFALAAYIGWHLTQLFRLTRWLNDPLRFPRPEVGGLWGEIYQRIHRMQQRSEARKRVLAGMLNRFQEAAAAMPDGTVVLREGNIIEWFNDAARRLLGLRATQDIGQPIANLLRHPAFVEFLSRGDYSQTVDIPSPADDTVTLTVRVVPYGNDQRLLLARDVTPLRRLERVRRDFVANVSHELRTPLTVVTGFLETMTDAGDECARKWSRSLSLMQQQMSRMRRIVEDLLLLSRLETNTAEQAHDQVSVPALLAAIREDAVALSGEKHHVLSLEADRGLWLSGNEKELRSAFSNIVFNAVQYTPAGGKIDIRWRADDAGAHLEVKDTGIGVAPHHIPRLTERFYRVDIGRSRESGGTGLGLAIVKHVLNRHNGTLRIASALNQGSTFICDFPASRIVRREK